ncbi:sushi, von Willebrand factor type A, EGF and pentraxin domain-containing protein 1-like [Glandiceps talaboti]
MAGTLSAYPSNSLSIQEQIRQAYRKKEGMRGKIELLGEKLKRRVQTLRESIHQEVELVFLVDSSSSVGFENFMNELKFVKKLLADFTVATWATRVAVVTFSSKHRVKVRIDHISKPNNTLHKCSLLNDEMPTITYDGGGTYTKGAFLAAERVLNSARKNSTQAVFLITDGYSNSGDPRPVAERLRKRGVIVFTFGIHNGNVRELNAMASEPKTEHFYILDSFEEFEALARRALHEDLAVGELIEQDLPKCSKLCSERHGCCDSIARCVCGIHTGQYQCICPAGYYGNGLQGGCAACPAGTYKPTSSVGGLSTCIQCPDRNHVSPEASTSLHQCVCKNGFSKIGGDQVCEEIACPKLYPPKQGYFVGGKCSNTYNSACGIRCKSGYEILGSSVRQCAQNGTWTGEEPSCRMKLCSPVKVPKHGKAFCNKLDYAFRTVCRFSCWSGYQLIGTARRECLAIGEWGGLPATCREITCPPLPQVENGVVSPPYCTDIKAIVQNTCIVKCKRGYERQGPTTYECLLSGEWSNPDKITTCTDIEPPELTCPLNLVVETSPNSNTATVDWKIPSGEDNSDDPVSIMVVPAVTPPHTFPIGVHDVRYTATDKSGNKEDCTFMVIVRDLEAPVIDRCRSPEPILSPDPMVFVDWEQPSFSDNSGEEVEITQSHYPGLFTWGTTVVEYKATDVAGNSRTCRIVIQVQENLCELPDKPLHGESDCSPTDNGIRCSLQCIDGYGFAIRPNPGYYCDADGAWYPPQQDSPWPDCSGKRGLTNAVKELTVKYRTIHRNCNITILDDIPKSFHHQMAKKIGDACRNGVVCKLDYVKAYCENTADYDETYKASDFDNDLRRRKRGGRSDISPEEYDLFLAMGVKGEVNLSKSSDENEEEHKRRILVDELTNLPITLDNEATLGNLDFYVGSNKLSPSNPIESQPVKAVCEEGTVLRGNKCGLA